MQTATRSKRWRRDRIRAARLYFVCEARPHGRDPRALLGAALRGGADLVQLRDKGLGDDDLVAAAAPFRDAAREHDALFILNDRPGLVEACGADGVHVGQDDMPVAEARRIAGPDGLVGLSTHSREQIDAAAGAKGEDRPDQISVGPVWETPTKAGRPAVGLELVRYAAASAPGIPWFAIGGIDASNVGEAVAAGAERVVVVRAIRDADDPEAAARVLRAAVQAAGSESQNGATFREVVAAFNDDLGDLRAVRHLFAREPEIRPLRHSLEGTSYRGPDAVDDFSRDTAESWSSIHLEIEDLHEHGDLVVTIGTLTGVGRGSGAQVSTRIGFVTELEDGKIARLTTYLDPAQALAVLDRREATDA